MSITAAQVVPTNSSSPPSTLTHEVESQDYLICFVNGKKYQLAGKDIQPESTLLHFLRQTCGLSGTKLVCGEGGCGACTVLLSKLDHSTGKVSHLSVNACLFPLGAIDGAHIITIEGIGNPKIGLHPIQIRLAEMNASQCGFCTPGIAMAFYALIRNNPSPTQKEIEHVMDGNLCRCTGYRPILDATKSFAADRDSPCGMGENCCRNAKKADAAATPAAASSSSSSSSAHKPIIDDCVPATPHADGMHLHQTSTCSKIASLAAHTPPTPLPQAFREDSALIFPPFLMKYQPRRIVLEKENMTWIKPSSLADLLSLKAYHTKAKNEVKLVCGNSEAGIDMKFRYDSRPWKFMIYCSDIPELKGIKKSADGKGVSVGASTTINELQAYLHHNITSYTPSSCLIAQSILDQIHWFAGTQIRNVATLGGNIVTASPISDLNPVWQAVDGVKMNVAQDGGKVRQIIGEKFFTGYRQTAMTAEEVLVDVVIPLVEETKGKDVAASSSSQPTTITSPVYTHSYKQSRRRADDIAIVTACMQMSVELDTAKKSLTFQNVRLSYGGMAPATALAHQTSTFLNGKPFSLPTIHSAFTTLKKDFPLLDAKVLPGGMAEYRMTLAASFLVKMFYNVWKLLGTNNGDVTTQQQFTSLLPPFPVDVDSAIAEYEREVSSGTQTYRVREVVHEEEKKVVAHEKTAAADDKNADPHAAVSVSKMAPPVNYGRNLLGDASLIHPAKSGEALRHMSALKQASGVAKFLDDIPLVRDEIYVALVLSTEPYAKILSIDSSVAATHPGYLGFWSSIDIPGSNDIGDIIKDEELFASEYVVCVGTIIGVCAGRTQIEAQQAAKMVKVVYEKLTPILTIEDAIEKNSYIAPWQDGHTLISGDVDAAFKDAPHTLQGESRIGGQEQFYLESMQCIITPGEDDEIHITGTTQNPNKTQQYIARVLGIGANKVVCEVKRMGGGFGGKETRCLHLFAAASIAARKTGQTVRLILDRDMDMSITGQRHAFLGKYNVAFTSEGKILGLKADIYANAGCSADLTMPVVDRALFHIENSYRFGAVRVTGKPCKTNLPSNTAFRGFGGPQGMFICETIMDHVAQYLKLRPEDVRRLNLYHEGDVTPYKQVLTEYTVPQQWDHLVSYIDLNQKRIEIADFNSKNRYKKRGYSIIPTKFGISFTAKFLNQAGALVLVYADGTVLVNHGGTEMGQGLHTKMCQVVAVTFGIPLSMVSLSDTATDKVANASPTAASASSDLNGAAVLDACHQILARLAPLREKHPDKKWADLCSLAYFERIGLAATGFYATPDVGYDFPTGKGTPFNYYTTGVAYSDVEVDVLTGDFTTLSSHICMDVGIPINPTIDIGQIEGAFTQGLGLFTMEELVWGDSSHPWVRPGNLQTKGPGTYKLPTANDIPIKMHIELWKGGKNSRALFSSKGVGEPPLFMASSVFFAIKNAVHQARIQSLGKEVGERPFIMNSPATAERIRMASCDEITKEMMKVVSAAASSSSGSTTTEKEEEKKSLADATQFQALGSF